MHECMYILEKNSTSYFFLIIKIEVEKQCTILRSEAEAELINPKFAQQQQQPPCNVTITQNPQI